MNAGLYDCYIVPLVPVLLWWIRTLKFIVLFRRALSVNSGVAMIKCFLEILNLVIISIICETSLSVLTLDIIIRHETDVNINDSFPSS